MFTLTGHGRFTDDPVLKRLDDKGTSVCEFTLAVDEFRRINGERKKTTNFFNMVIWDKAAELICEYKKKGDPIYVVATPRLDRWTDPETGEGRSRVIFRINEFSFLSSARRAEEAEVAT